MLIDAQVHVISPDQDRYPLSPAPMPRPAWFDQYGRSVEQLLAEMDELGIERTVLVQAHSAYRFDNRYAVDSTAVSPRFLCTAAIDADDDPVKAARYFVTEHGVRGLRLFLHLYDPAWVESKEADTLFDEIEELGAIAQVLPTADHLPALLRAAKRHPGLPVLVDHCGYPDLSGGAGYPNARGLFALEEAANIRLKLSTHVFELAHEGGVPLAQITEDLVADFGASRIMWASDLTVQSRSYAAVLGDANEACAGLASADRELIMGGTAARFWWRET